LRRGIFAWTEVIASLPLLGLLVALAGAGVLRHQRVRAEYSARQTAAWAAAAQLQRYQAGASMDSLPPDNLLTPEVKLVTQTQSAAPPWEGYSLVTVTATVGLNESDAVSERVSGYVRQEGQR
jgi:type II secretory pathway pseudopilin PulG